MFAVTFFLSYSSKHALSSVSRTKFCDLQARRFNKQQDAFPSNCATPQRQDARDCFPPPSSELFTGTRHHRSKRLRKTHIQVSDLKQTHLCTCANFPGFGTDARGQRPCRCFQLRGPRTKVHGPVRLQNVRLYLSQSFRGQVHRGQVELMSREPRTPADNGGHPRTLSFLWFS